MNDSTNECKTLLFNFKSILDVVLSPRLRTAICNHDPIRLHLAIQKIITHQLKYFDTWPFTDPVTAQPKDVQLRRDKRLLWIGDSIEKNTLGESVRTLVGDAEFLANIYQEQAFLRQSSFAEAFLICISAFERQQQNLLSQIDHGLLTILSSGGDVQRPGHKRSNSHPHFTLEVPGAVKAPLKRSTSENQRTKQIFNLNLRPWFSLPNLATCSPRPRSRSKTICSTDDRWTPVRVSVQPATPKVPSFTYTPIPSTTNLLATSSASVARQELTPNYDAIEIHFDRSHTPKRPKKPLMARRTSKKLINFIIGFDPEDFTSGDEARNFSTSPVAAGFIPEILVKEGEKMPKSPRTNFLDDLASAATTSSRAIPKPFSGQSLPDFLKRIQSSANKNADLDRENAHMIVSEAIIAAIEQLKCNQFENAREELRFRRSEPSASSSFVAKSSVESGGEFASVSSSYGSPGCYVSESETEVPELVTLPSQQEVIEADLAAIEWEEADDATALSAEGVALSLLSKFNAKQLPCASEIMMWMVSEKDAPQQILPMPSYLIANPDNPEYNGSNTIIRGTKEWAPPRQQIIFTRHPPLERKKLMAQQNNRCAGCGMKVAPMYSNRFRFCDYLGKMLCSGCHKNQMSAIPARILETWDFHLYPVSVFAYRLLDQMWMYPLFRVCDLNPQLFEKINSLKLAKQRRQQLRYVKDLITTCHFAEEHGRLLDALPLHLAGDDLEVWSMSDFASIKTGTFNKELQELVKKCGEHVVKCEFCLARGFICELCTKKDTIFPWQPKIKRCDKCGTCYHEKCWLATSKCNKCERLRKRQRVKIYSERPEAVS